MLGYSYNISTTYIDGDNLVHNPFTNLQVLVIRELAEDLKFEECVWSCKEMDIQDCPLLTRGGTLSEFPSKIKRTWNEDEDGNEIN